ncbi:MAG: ACT domain-containing protein, partial [Desulfovibrionaceae bacterium]|nr:ACT domain-containing protein [Desulfovibrionaceae bacterium]
WTRFVIIARAGDQNRLGSLPQQKSSAEGNTKTSLLFTLTDKPGALSSVLNLFAANKINMRKLESRPMTGQCWRYFFFADVETDLCREEYREVLLALDALCTNVRVLGSYPTGPQLDRVWEPADGGK